MKKITLYDFCVVFEQIAPSQTKDITDDLTAFTKKRTKALGKNNPLLYDFFVRKLEDIVDKRLEIFSEWMVEEPRAKQYRKMYCQIIYYFILAVLCVWEVDKGKVKVKKKHMRQLPKLLNGLEKNPDIHVDFFRNFIAISDEQILAVCDFLDCYLKDHRFSERARKFAQILFLLVMCIVIFADEEYVL